MNQTTMITQSTVISMGFTKALIAKLLPEPKLVDNPHCKKAAPMRLFNKQDVLDAMELEEFRLALEKREKRKIAAAKATETKTNNLIDKMSNLGKGIYIEVIPDTELVDRVLENNKSRILYRLENQVDYLERKEYWDEYDEAVKELEDFEFHRPNEETLNRWIINYIRHNLLKYDEALLKLRGQTGKQDGYIELKKQILYKIAITYPKYADECRRQAEEL